MKKKIISIIIATSMLVFSFYYTYKSRDIVQKIDPIMLKIEKNTDKFTVKAIDATIKDNTIIPGLKGKTVDTELSYKKMKKYGAYNESLTTIKEVNPTISVKDNYNKYIVSGNKKKKQVSLIFYIENISDLILITNYLDKERVAGTLLINTNLLDYEQEIQKVKHNEIELLFNKTTQVEISQYSNYFYSITGKKNLFCISNDYNDELLKICRKYKMHTVMPNLDISNNSVSNIKKRLNNGSIIYMEISDSVKKNIDYIIFYIKSKGYSIVSLDNLLVE